MTQPQVAMVSPGGEIRYADTRAHFESAVLRLMRMTEAQFVRWLELAERQDGDLLDRLGSALPELGHLPLMRGRPEGADSAPGPGGREGRLWLPSIADAPQYGVSRDSDRAFGWLVRHERGSWVHEPEPPVYEEEYFEGAASGAAGYGGYTDQEPWRVEKARTQLSELRRQLGLKGGRALDIGSGYGYFRVALAEAGWEHEGLDVSAFARRVARDRYDFATHSGTLDDHAERWSATFDLITLWDVIEHVPDPLEFLRTAASCLRPGGVLAARTPNLDCPEADHFGPYYHSLQRPHLIYFTPASLAATAADAGLENLGAQTASHLLQGFVDRDTLTEWASSGRGADFTAYYRRR